MIENIGSSLGTAIIATVVASMLAFNHPSIFQSLKAYRRFLSFCDCIIAYRVTCVISYT